MNEAGERYTFELDPAGRVVKETGFDGRAREYVRDIAGRPTLTVLPSGRTTTSTYDVMNRLVEARHSDKTFAKFEYAVDGLLTRAENEASVVEMERDSLGRVVREVVNGRAVESQYDASGARTELRSSLGARVVTVRDSVGQPAQMFIGPADGFRDADVTFERDGAGFEARRRFRNGVDLEWTRDRAGRPTARRTFRREPALTPIRSRSLESPSREELEARVYQWQGERSIAAILDSSTGPSFYDHDSRGRLVRERRAGVVIDRMLDKVGNVHRSREDTERRFSRGGALEEAATVRYTYDLDGNRIGKSGTDGDWRYVWNGHGMLTHVDRPDGMRVLFEYDGFARRTKRQITGPDNKVERETIYVWDRHTQVHEIDSEHGVTTWHWEPEALRLSTRNAMDKGGPSQPIISGRPPRCTTKRAFLSGR